MKKKLIASLLLICTVFCSLFGCSGRDYGGIVTDFYLTDTHVVIQTSDKLDEVEYYCYCSLWIYKNQLEEYNCHSLNDILLNKEFASAAKCTALIQSFGLLKLSDQDNLFREKIAYILLYDGMELPEDYNLPDSFFEVEDLTNYRGYIKF